MARTLEEFDPEDMAKIKEQYGEPREFSFEADFLDFECELVRRSALKGRNHDITCFIRDGEQFVVIQKHDYAETGIYRAPSGGAKLDESIEEAAKREMYEETGLEVRLLKFVIDVHLDVRCRDESIVWRSLCFLAEPIGGTMEPVDEYEIYDVSTMTREQLLGEVADLMEASGWGGFKYRAFLTRTFFSQLDST